MTFCGRCDGSVVDQDQEPLLEGGQPPGELSGGVGVLLDLVHVLIERFEVSAELPGSVVAPLPTGAGGRHLLHGGTQKAEGQPGWRGLELVGGDVDQGVIEVVGHDLRWV